LNIFFKSEIEIFEVRHAIETVPAGYVAGIYEHTSNSTGRQRGTTWTLMRILSLAVAERQRFFESRFAFSRPAGAEDLRAAIADMQDVNVDTVQVVSGASEALLILFWLPRNPEPTFVLPQPGYPPFFRPARISRDRDRYYRRSEGERLLHRSDEIEQLADGKPVDSDQQSHNPTGATISDEELDSLHEFAASVNSTCQR